MVVEVESAASLDHLHEPVAQLPSRQFAFNVLLVGGSRAVAIRDQPVVLAAM